MPGGQSQQAIARALTLYAKESLNIDLDATVYALDATPLRDIDDWLERFRTFWPVRLDALATEIARGKKARGES